MERAYVVVRHDGRTQVFQQGANESATEWALRAKSAMNGEESMANYTCTTLTGCKGGEEIEVCTPCPSGTPQEECDATHAESVAAFCRVFECDC